MINKKGLIRNLHLIKEIAITDFKLKYQGSVFGYLWSLVKPLAYFGVLFLVFNNFFKLGKSIPNYPIYLLLGVVIFSFWSEATTVSMYSIASRGDLIRKIYFPRIVLVIASTITSTITLILNLSIVVLLALLTGVHFGTSMLVILLLIVEIYLFIVGLSFYLSAFFVKFRDVGHIWEVAAQIIFYATPIVYPLSLVPNNFAKFMILSPLAQVIQDARKVFVNPETLSVSDYWQFPFNLFPILLVFVLLISGYFVFQKMAAKFAEEI
jgi:ABC-2 type transport system permease protein